MAYVYKVVKHKTNIQGYWKDKEDKLYIDNIDLVECRTLGQLSYEIENLFKIGELAVFYKCYNKAYVINKEGSKIQLNKRISWKEDNKPDEAYILELLKNTEGLTVIKEDNQYIIEIWKV